MNILQIAPQVPYPLSDGGKVGIYNITKHLALRGHSITMLALDRNKGVDPKPLKEFCELMTVPHSNRNSFPKAIGNLFSDLPYGISKYRSKDYLHILKRLLQERPFDVVHVDHLHMAHYGVLCKQMTGVPIVLREHNVESVILERLAENVRMPLFRQWLAAQRKRIRTYEAEQTALFDLCCVITEQDRRRLQELNPTVRTRIIPGGIDATYFESQSNVQKIPDSICFFGSFDWIANHDGLTWFLEEVFPAVLLGNPKATLYVVGKGIPEKLKTRHSERVVWRGYVPDLKQEVQHYELAVVPIRIGGGMRLKILESFAMRIPVVSTSVGCEGIECQNEKHLLIGDSEEEFAQQVLRLFSNKELKNSLVNNAFALAKEKYRWEIVAEEFEKTYEQVLEQKHPGKQDLHDER